MSLILPCTKSCSMKWPEAIKDYLTFSRKERVGVIIILIVTLLSILLPAFFSRSSKGFIAADSTLLAAIEELERKSTRDSVPETAGHDHSKYYQYDQRQQQKAEHQKSFQLFYFDPNTLSGENWEKLGISRKTANTIRNYLAKGGRFRNTEDLSNIYGMREEDYKRIAPYVRIAQGDHKKNGTGLKTTSQGLTSSKRQVYQPIDINTADTAAFITLPGIGSKLASRIISFREKLGGFYSVHQVSETFGLADSTFQKISSYLKLEDRSVRKININTATVDEMKNHPYLRYKVAQAIATYRHAHGPFQKIADLKKLMVITDEQLIKASPYLTLGE